MINTPHRSYPVTDRSYVAILKREVRLLATELSFSAKKLGEIDIIIAELTSNLVKYAREGELLVRPITRTVNPGLEFISLDNGPGMVDTRRMMTDGVSTGGSLGQGLGAIGRLADVFQLYSLPGRGTVGLVRVFQKPVSPPIQPALADVQAVIVPRLGETACGDGIYSRLTTTALKVFLSDGLGHGLLAQKATQQALRTLESQYELNPATWLTAVHRATINSRGLAGTGAVFEFASRKWKLCGVGNIRAQINGSQKTRGYMAQNGILGYNIPRTLIEQEFSYEPGQCLIMASDGIQTRWNPARYPGAGRYDPTILAAAIYKEHARRTDDVSVLVARIY
ncbi:SpoIIE family protein phosphatase [Spirosoma taeanense]|uniref:SpoIIE family protein phosphatase n=1 Tax=Spirosoma taeanense TaxID=2735870 RepID=A0A6M5YDQ2_9BACT|nr:ATP-binding SpoIIE family protein phosphatase [Spirosoma taeanense]QJW91421.1 SpoIIE family protein phosphatase [Spirosoma taeanense]